MQVEMFELVVFVEFQVEALLASYFLL